MLCHNVVHAEQPLETALQYGSVDVVRYFATEAGIYMRSYRGPVCVRVCLCRCS
jgi:hypothetical protein